MIELALFSPLGGALAERRRDEPVIVFQYPKDLFDRSCGAKGNLLDQRLVPGVVLGNDPDSQFSR